MEILREGSLMFGLLKNTKVFFLLSVFLFTGCSEGDFNLSEDKSASFLIGENSFKVPLKYFNKVKYEKYISTNSLPQHFSIDVCLPDLVPALEHCSGHIGWGDKLYLYVGIWSGYNANTFLEKVVDRQVSRGRWLEMGESDFSSELLHYVELVPPPPGEIGKEERYWVDHYIGKEMKTGSYFKMLCRRKREDFSPSCRVKTKYKGLSISYNYGLGSLKDYKRIHEDIVSLIESFRK